MKIPYELKRACVEARETKTAKEIYKELFLPQHSGMSYETFRHCLKKWSNQQMADNNTLALGTYEGFTPHGATVQVDGNGNIRQAWIKQSVDYMVYEQILDAIKSDIRPIEIPAPAVTEEYMLEISLLDMHFGVAKLEDYTNVLAELLSIIKSRKWEEINIIIGQDLLHTNDMRGHTAKGTDIGAIDFRQAWKDARTFWYKVIDAALENSTKVKLRYSKGNHDECTSWCFLQELWARYPQAIVEDSLSPRKCIYWKGCFIGYGHCEYTGSLNKLFQDFVLDFPTEFANAEVREIHTGHLHSESKDTGLMVRRLASGVPTDKWSADNGYVGAHKRFEVFVWSPNRLNAIHYLSTAPVREENNV